MNAPVITVEIDADTGDLILMATSYGQCMPAGPRLFRGGDLPAISFVHTDEMEALRDKEMLQRYCDLAYSGKVRKTRGEEPETVTTPTPNLEGAWWL